MIIFVDEEEEKRKEEQLREEGRQEMLESFAKNYQRMLEELKKGKSLKDIMEENYYNSLGVEDQIYYEERRRVRKFLEELKQARPA